LKRITVYSGLHDKIKNAFFTINHNEDFFKV
jgi:hypothetical protein